MLVGVGSRIEIWNKDKWMEANTFDDMEEIAEHMEAWVFDGGTWICT